MLSRNCRSLSVNEWSAGVTKRTRSLRGIKSFVISFVLTQHGIDAGRIDDADSVQEIGGVGLFYRVRFGMVNHDNPVVRKSPVVCPIKRFSDRFGGGGLLCGKMKG